MSDYLKGIIRKMASFRRRRVFVLTDALDYREVRFFRTRVGVFGILIGLVTVGTLLIANHSANDILGLGYNQLSLLSTENSVLKEQLLVMSNRMADLEQEIDGLADRGNDLRLVVDLTPLDEDTRTAGVGGSQSSADLSYISGEANEILSNSRLLLDQLTREVQLQKNSYEEIYRQYQDNKTMFAHVPSIKPIAGRYSIRGYGMRIHPVLGIRRMHEGIDIIADVGTNIYAAADGVVRYAGRTRGGYGTVVEVSHGYGYSTLYAHVSKTLVKPGQKVTRGDIIARSGRTGLVSGPHLHYEVRRWGRKMNPVDYFFDDVDAASFQAELQAVSLR
ncbi:MAG: M23 family metallopeptidase [Ignavibacteria bacterium]|nr:M23 family metallopeptidase [Ignavibacteria bacterium]